MPMNWTPSNDQILLLKLIETHNISVDGDKIAKAWPPGDVQPTKRAITERFVRLRQMNKDKVPGTPAKNKVKIVSTPTSSARKRKVNKAQSEEEESDAESHRTPSSDYITPKSRRTNAGGHASNAMSELPKTPDGEVDWNEIARRKGIETPSKKPVPIKKEPNPDDLFDDVEFARQFQHARQLRGEINANASGGIFESSYAMGGYDMPTPISGTQSSLGNSPSAMDGNHDDMAFNPFGSGHGMDLGIGMDDMENMNDIAMTTTGMGIGMNVTAGQHHLGMMMMPQDFQFHNPIQSAETLVRDAQQLNLSPSNSFGRPCLSGIPTPRKLFSSSASGKSAVRPAHISISAPPSDLSFGQLGTGSGAANPGSHSPVLERRVRTPRKASEGVQAYIKYQKEDDRAHGDRTSDEDSAESEFEEDSDEI
ncbi:uncharacterized protein BDR25DRAFT_385605 [Lindgomyces ingoldianus]|uniref:Uncharacterized protein n=1 Tax=Lindgomyces ingoldianus TaxID=673940 RepID=A0ACB6R5U2_9PLEO|nr:uncharacterized protein BDR25DRAFT_385605 [Lindgomyces ingoldianus]KAF2474145.1 hypothetical protein BDR25DRAFT_385605 [Lindgomyces ingoldianus]